MFDEVHFGKFISGYFTHEYFFDIHPPLGKLLISAAGWVGGFKPGFSFGEIGQSFPDNTYLWLRLLPTLAGALLPMIIFLLALRLGFSQFASFIAGILVVLENSLVAQSRFILLDSFLLLFGFSALLFYFIYKENARIKYLFLSGIMAALAVSVKWTGAAFLGIIAVMQIYEFVKTPRTKSLIYTPLALLAIPFVIYFSIFALHFTLLFKSGGGDAFMTPSFQKTLENNLYKNNETVKPIGLVAKFVELNKQMYKSNATLIAGHPHSSKWISWPFMIRPIYYWSSQCRDCPVFDSQSRIYLLGNPIIWWASTIAMVSILLGLFQGILKRNFRDKNGIFLATAFLVNLLPFVGIKRAMFLYHYMPALIFAILGLVYLIDQYENKKKIFIVLVLLSAASFVFFSPLTYGLKLSDKAFNARMWMNSWR